MDTTKLTATNVAGADSRCLSLDLAHRSLVVRSDLGSRLTTTCSSRDSIFNPYALALARSLSLDYSRSQAFVLLSNKNNNSQRFPIIYRTIIEYRLFINHGYANVTAEERELSANQ